MPEKMPSVCLQQVRDILGATFPAHPCFQLCSSEVMEMKKASLLVVLALGLIGLSAGAPKANAGVLVGVQVGTPVYVHPARPYYFYGIIFMDLGFSLDR